MNKSCSKTARKQAPEPKRSIGKPFEPGRSGNPGGRPKGSFSLKASIRRVATHNDFDAIAKRLISLARNGSLKAVKLVAELVGDLGVSAHVEVLGPAEAQAAIDSNDPPIPKARLIQIIMGVAQQK